MPRSVRSRTPGDPVVFGLEQLRPRTVLGGAITGLAHWFADHLVPYPDLIHAYGTAVVVGGARLDYPQRQVRFAEAPWLSVTSSVEAGAGGRWLRLRTAVAAADRPAARAEVLLRVVRLDGDDALSAVPGELPPALAGRFAADERFVEDPRAVARLAAGPPAGNPLGPPAELPVTLYRSRLDTADQWSFIEVAELLTEARERAGLLGGGKQALTRPIRTMSLTMRRALFAFDDAVVTTRGFAAGPGHGDAAVFTHTMRGPRGVAPCLTGWELLG